MRVLQAAEEAFAEKGYAGTSLKAVSDRSGISVGLILHHFSTKEALYHEVLKGLSAGYFRVLTEAGQGMAGHSFQETAAEVLRRTFEFWRNDTTHHRISLWSYLENRSTQTDAETQLTTGLAEIITKMQAAGSIDPSVSPFVFLSMIIGPIQFWMRYRQQFMEQLNLKETSEELDAIFLDQFLRVTEKIMKSEELR